MEQISRREFFSRKVLGQVWNKAIPMEIISKTLSEKLSEPVGHSNATPVDGERVVMQDYFSSPLYSYALLSEMPWEMLADEAQKRGIPFEGRSKMDIVRELFTGEKDGG